MATPVRDDTEQRSFAKTFAATAARRTAGERPGLVTVFLVICAAIALIVGGTVGIGVLVSHQRTEGLADNSPAQNGTGAPGDRSPGPPAPGTSAPGTSEPGTPRPGVLPGSAALPPTTGSGNSPADGSLLGDVSPSDAPSGGSTPPSGVPSDGPDLGMDDPALASALGDDSGSADGTGSGLGDTLGGLGGWSSPPRDDGGAGSGTDGELGTGDGLGDVLGGRPGGARNVDPGLLKAVTDARAEDRQNQQQPADAPRPETPAQRVARLRAEMIDLTQSQNRLAEAQQKLWTRVTQLERLRTRQSKRKAPQTAARQAPLRRELGQVVHMQAVLAQRRQQLEEALRSSAGPPAGR